MPRHIRLLAFIGLTTGLLGTSPFPPAGAQEAPTSAITGAATFLTPTFPMAVCVSARDLNRDVVAWTTTDPTSHRYQLEVPAGEYFVKFDGNCNGLAAVPELYDDAERWSEATTVTVAPGETVEANAHLAVWSRIQGRIVDQFGSPVICAVHADAVGGETVVATTSSTSPMTGSFMASAPAGTRSVSFDCPDAHADPSPLVVEVGAPSTPTDVGTLVAPLQPRSVSGTVAPDDGLGQVGDVGDVCVVATSTTGVIVAVTDAPSGRWSMAGLPVGPIRLAFAQCQPDVYQYFLPEWYRDTTVFAEATDVVVLADAPVAGITAEVTRYAYLEVELRDPDDVWVGGACVWITDPAVTTLVAASYVWPQFSFGGARLPPGDYKILVTDCGGGWSPTWYGGGADPASAATVHVSWPGVHVVHTVLP